MDARLLRRPVLDLFSGRSPCLIAGNVSAQRHESSHRRTKKSLKVKTEPSFLFSKDFPRQDHIIFNPPSSVPSVLHTPIKFLPKDDPRRNLFAAAATSTLAQVNSSLPPALLEHKPGYQRHHLTEKDVAEIRRLRTSDPERWSAHKLGKKFNCTSRFITICCQAPEEKKAAEKVKLDAIKARWGPKRTLAREDRVKRREAVYRDE
ncbi:MAG: hypothetical protein M1818_002647 [Claussenomyces sp. TS43310]|nr:MAG: hypothetical protein M1818_002647 [Claussenomyces sp. TS43310]